MAKTSKIVRMSRPPKYKTRAHSRCRRCGRPRAVYRKFGYSSTMQAPRLAKITLNMGVGEAKQD